MFQQGAAQRQFEKPGDGAGQTEFALQPNVAAAAKKAYESALQAHRTSAQAWGQLRNAMNSAPTPQLKRDLDVLMREYGDIMERIDQAIQDLDPVNF